MSFNTISEAMKSGQTLVFGHRGAMAQAPMNTMASFQAAYDQGADGIELDLQMSRDGQLVIVHDFTVDATTDGRGSVADLPLSALKALDAGSWYGEAFARETIPTLGEVFESFGAELLINVEIKSATEESAGIEGRLADAIDQYGMGQRVIISSFNAQVLRRFRAISPHIMIGCLYPPLEAGAREKGLPFEAIHPWQETVDEEYMAWARDNELYVNCWTVNDPGRALALEGLGVNAIITDDPAAIIAAIRR